MEKVLITGGAGYLGSVMTGYFLDKGYEVTCLDNLMYKQHSLFNYVRNPNFDFVYGDSRDENLIKETICDKDVIIPLAAIVGMPACNKKPEDAVSINRDAILLIDKLRSKNQKIIYPNTNSGYGAKSGAVFCTEETPLEPISVYGILKCETETALLNSDKGAITLRLATVFGTSPRMRTDLLVNDFVLTSLTDKKITIYEKHFKRNYIYIADIARCFEHCIVNYEEMIGKPYNMGLENANLSKQELAEKVQIYVPDFKVTYDEIGQDVDKRNYIVSNKRIIDSGFKTIFSLDDGIKELIKGYSLLLKNLTPGNLREFPYTNK